jgi:hypothetical protein
LDSLSDATQGYEAVVDILKRIDEEYGMAGAPAAARPTTSGSQAPRKTPTTGTKQKRDIKDIFGG